MTQMSKNAPWQSYELLSSGNGQRLERWGERVILRPESEALWPWKEATPLPAWDGRYSGERASGGEWSWRAPLPDPCVVTYGGLSFLIKPTASKHLGLFPEQSTNWDWIRATIGAAPPGTTPIKVLNLFGYTGGATLAAASAGAHVTHVDASRAMVSWCSENASLSGLSEAPIRYLVEDAVTFLRREIRRGNLYDGIIMDPPSFGRGKKGELWKLSEHLPYLIDTAQEALAESPLFLLLNTYSDAIDDLAQNMISKRLSRLGGACDIVALGQIGTLDQQWLPGGIAHRWAA